MEPDRAQRESPSGPIAATAREATGIGLQVKRRISERMARECEAMVQFALSTGRTVSFEVVEQLDQALSAVGAPAAATVPSQQSAVDASPVEATVGSSLSTKKTPLASLSVAHSALAHIIAPATPEATLLLADERVTHPRLYALGPPPIVRQTLGLAILSLVLLLSIALSEEVNAANMAKTVLTMAGYSLFIKEIYLVSAASLGSCFRNLQIINVVISKGTYDPKFQSTYWTRWVMGVISGVILSQLVFIFLMQGTQTDASVVPPTFGQPILALLGGYSGDLVHGILSHTIDTIAGFFRIASDPVVDNQQRGQEAEVTVQERLTTTTTADLIDLLRDLDAAPSLDADEIRKRLDSLIQRSRSLRKPG
jgi:hypothetical protein